MRSAHGQTAPVGELEYRLWFEEGGEREELFEGLIQILERRLSNQGFSQARVEGKEYFHFVVRHSSPDHATTMRLQRIIESPGQLQVRLVDDHLCNQFFEEVATRFLYSENMRMR